MKHISYISILLPIIILHFLTGASMAQNIRPIRDNVGFCWTPSEMDTLISYLNSIDKNDNFSSNNLVAGISPHDDYLYAGKIYLPLYKLIHSKEIVIFGVTHGTVRKAMNNPKDVLIFDDYNEWHGPYSKVEISPLREIIKNKLNKNEFIVSDKAQKIEHSIEALVPFLQYYNRNIKITPVMITEMQFERMEKISNDLSEIITDYINERKLELGKDIFFLISTDANHYGEDFNNKPYGDDMNAHFIATKNDRRIANAAFNGELTKIKIKNLTNELWTSEKNRPAPVWCGKYSVPFGLLTINKIVSLTSNKKLNGEIFRYSDTWTEGVIPIKHTNLGTTAPFSLKHWCGFLSAGFYLK